MHSHTRCGGSGACFECWSDKLFYASSEGRIESVRNLLKAKPNWRKKLEGHRAIAQALFEASSHGHVDVLRIMAKKARDMFESYEEDGETILIHSIRARQSEVCLFLLNEVGVDPEKRDLKLRATPLMLAVGEGLIDVIKALVLEKRVDLHATSLDGHTCACFAAEMDDGVDDDVDAGGDKANEVFDFLYDHLGPSMSDMPCKLKGQCGTMLHHAANAGALKCCQWLIEKKGANPLASLPNGCGHLPVHRAAGCGHLEVLRYFIRHVGLSPDQRTALFPHATLLHCIASMMRSKDDDDAEEDEKERLACVEWLCEEAGADKDAICERGFTAAERAKQQENYLIYNYLTKEERAKEAEEAMAALLAQEEQEALAKIQRMKKKKEKKEKKKMAAARNLKSTLGVRVGSSSSGEAAAAAGGGEWSQPLTSAPSTPTASAATTKITRSSSSLSPSASSSSSASASSSSPASRSSSSSPSRIMNDLGMTGSLSSFVAKPPGLDLDDEKKQPRKSVIDSRPLSSSSPSSSFPSLAEPTISIYNGNSRPSAASYTTSSSSVAGTAAEAYKPMSAFPAASSSSPPSSFTSAMPSIFSSAFTAPRATSSSLSSPSSTWSSPSSSSMLSRITVLREEDLLRQLSPKKLHTEPSSSSSSFPPTAATKDEVLSPTPFPFSLAYLSSPVEVPTSSSSSSSSSLLSSFFNLNTSTTTNTTNTVPEQRVSSSGYSPLAIAAVEEEEGGWVWCSNEPPAPTPMGRLFPSSLTATAPPPPPPPPPSPVTSTDDTLLLATSIVQDVIHGALHTTTTFPEEAFLSCPLPTPEARTTAGAVFEREEEKRGGQQGDALSSSFTSYLPHYLALLEESERLMAEEGGEEGEAGAGRAAAQDGGKTQQRKVAETDTCGAAFATASSSASSLILELLALPQEEPPSSPSSTYSFPSSFSSSASDDDATAISSSTKKDKREQEVLTLSLRVSTLFCPLSTTIMTDPVLACDGHSYQRLALQTYLDEVEAEGKELRSPVTQELMSLLEYFPNYALRNQVRLYLVLQRDVMLKIMEEKEEEVIHGLEVDDGI